jgi:hypothetical protein
MVSVFENKLFSSGSLVLIGASLLLSEVNFGGTEMSGYTGCGRETDDLKVTMIN